MRRRSYWLGSVVLCVQGVCGDEPCEHLPVAETPLTVEGVDFLFDAGSICFEIKDATHDTVTELLLVHPKSRLRARCREGVPFLCDLRPAREGGASRSLAWPEVEKITLRLLRPIEDADCELHDATTALLLAIIVSREEPRRWGPDACEDLLAGRWREVLIGEPSPVYDNPFADF